MRRSGKSKPVVWRWQARFMAEGVAGLTRDKTRKPGKKSLPASTVQRVIDLVLVPPKASGSFVAETFLPAPDHHLGLAGGLHDLSRAATIGRQKHDLGPPSVLLRAIAVGDHSLKLATVGSAQLDVRSLVHPLDSHTPVLQGIPKRIEVSDLVH